MGITEKTLGRQTRSVVPVLDPRSKPKKSRFFEEEEEEDDDEDGKEGGNGGAGGGGGEASSTGKSKKSGKAGKSATEASPVADALSVAEEDGAVGGDGTSVAAEAEAEAAAEAGVGPEVGAEQGGSGTALLGRTAPPTLAPAPRPLMVTRSLSAYIHVSRDDDR